MSKISKCLIASTLLAMGVLLFTRLGHNALWDDEALTALGAKGVMQTGDTSISVGLGNLVAFRGGISVRGLSERSTPPLANYLTAVSFLLFGINAWSARLPFALFGFATAALMLLWVHRKNWPTILVLALGMLGNVSFILYFRQCRYYGSTMFLSVAIAWIYWEKKPSPRNLLILAALSVLLFVSNYMGYLALYLGLTLDYVIWKRKEWPLTWRNGLLLFGPQLVLNGAVACIWNPLRTPFGGYEAMNSLVDRLTLFCWYWRDLNGCEFFSLPVLLLALVVGLRLRHAWLVRGCIAMLVYVTVITFASPQPVELTSRADIRYASAIIPLAISLEAGALCALCGGRKILLIAVAILVFGTNLFNGGPFLDHGFRSTLIDYAGELLHPPPEPYTPTAQWINDHVPAGDSIWVLPDYAAYPLMFHAPRALYAWQFNWPPRPDFAGLPLIHFQGQEPPDYLIAFGPALEDMAHALQNWKHPGVSYDRVAMIDVFWKDLYRPELFWRSFEPITNFDPNSQAIYIFRRSKPPIATP
jgi:hypothetical protein